MPSNASTPVLLAKEWAEALLAQLPIVQAQADYEKQEEWECAEWEEHKKIEAARVAAEEEEVQKAQRAAKWAEKWKAAEEVVVEVVVVVDGPSEEARPKKRAKIAESNVSPDRDREMEAVETACNR